MVLMVLFCAAIRRDSVFLSKFPFFSYVQVFSWAIFSICCLKYPCSCFSFHFCFLAFVVFLSVLILSLLLLTAVISLSLLFLKESSMMHPHNFHSLQVFHSSSKWWFSLNSNWPHISLKIDISFFFYILSMQIANANSVFLSPWPYQS